MARAVYRPRQLNWDACYNIRETGGYKIVNGCQTPWRVLLRADNLCRLTPEGQAALVAYGVRTIIDLRSTDELAAALHPFAHPRKGVEALTYWHCPLIDSRNPTSVAEIEAAETQREAYCLILDRYPRHVAHIVRTVAEAPMGSVLVHCHSGKDRTGIITAILLALAGVSPKTIADDYTLSRAYLQPYFDEILRVAPDDPVRRARLEQRLASDPNTMLAMLSHLDARYQGVHAYLSAAGITKQEVDSIRSRLS